MAGHETFVSSVSGSSFDRLLRVGSESTIAIAFSGALGLFVGEGGGGRGFTSMHTFRVGDSFDLTETYPP